MTAPRSFSLHRTRGFTLVELVIVIVITGIIGGMVAVFIRVPVQGYVDATARANLADTADIATRRVTRDVRLALPNSVRVSPDGRYLELLLTHSGGRYLSDDDGPGLGDVLGFDATATYPNPNRFTVVGAAPVDALGARQQIQVGDSIVVYNLGPGYEPANAYNCAAGCNRATVTGVFGNSITLANNPFVTQQPPLPSPSHRFQVVSTPVTYVCNAVTGTLTRYSAYAIQAAQPVDASAAPLAAAPVTALLAGQGADCSFSYAQLANVQRGLVGITLKLGAANSNTGTVSLLQQVQVANTP
jgi:MSHA biogenesis protein MshO